MKHPVFRATELLDMAVQIERHGLEFYETCLGLTTHPQVKKVLQFMAKEEGRHIEVFTRMKNGLQRYELPESYPGEMQAYVESFVKGKVFLAPEEGPNTLPLGDVALVIDTAIGFEQRSILFYSAMKQVVRPSEGEVVEQVIAEEHSHIRRLLALRNDLGSTNVCDRGRG